MPTLEELGLGAADLAAANRRGPRGSYVHNRAGGTGRETAQPIFSMYFVIIHFTTTTPPNYVGG